MKRLIGRPEGRHGLVLIAYSLLALVMTWPQVTQLGRAIPGDGFDGWQNLWNLWWMRQAWLVEHASAYFTDLLHYPTGADLRFQTMAPFNGLVTLNVQTALGLFQAYNTAVLLSFVLGGYGTYLLALYAMNRQGPPQPAMLNSRPAVHHGAAFVAGLIYAFAPYHFAHLLGHLQLIVLQWIPFCLLYLVRGLDRRQEGRGQWASDTFKAGLMLILVGLCDWYYVMYCLFFTALLLVVRLIQRRLSWRSVALVLGAGGLFGLSLAPLLLPMVQGARDWGGISLLREYSETLNLSADLLAFVTPQVFHPVWGDWAAQRSSAFTATPSEYTVFAGFTVLFLAAIALLARRRGTGAAGIWLLAAGFFALLSLGPLLHVNGRTNLLPGGGEIPLPYALLYHTIPFMKLSRSVSRMDVMVMLCLAVAAAIGLAWLARPQRVAAKDSPRWLRSMLPGLAALLVLLEFLPVPYPVSQPDTPTWYSTLALMPSGQAVLNLPTNWQRPGYLLYQTVHGKPMTTGYITRDDPDTLWERAPVIGHFRWLGTDIHTVGFDLSRQGMQVLHDLLDVGWVVLDRFKMPGGDERALTEAYAAAIFQSAGVEPLFADQRLTVYPVIEPDYRGPYLILAANWPPRQVDDQGQAFRQLPPGQAGLDLVTPRKTRLALEIEAAGAAGSGLQVLGGDDALIGAWPLSTQAQVLRTPSWEQGAGTAHLQLVYRGPAQSQATVHAIRLVEE